MRAHFVAKVWKKQCLSHQFLFRSPCDVAIQLSGAALDGRSYFQPLMRITRGLAMTTTVR
jgi:hypothetical protein